MENFNIAAVVTGAVAALAMSLSPVVSQAQAARNYVSVVGSSTVYPFATVVAERLGKSGRVKTPKVESTGSGGGIKLFCGGVGVQFPDVANSSRALKKSEFDNCARNGVKDIIEVRIGYDGIVLAESVKAPGFKLTRRDIFLALAKQVPNPNGTPTLVANPHRQWKSVNAGLPATRIEVLGPPPTSGTRDAFVELAMEGGCKTFPWIAALKEKDEARFKSICQTVREDGAFIEAGENDNLIVQKLVANPQAVGIFGYSFLDQNKDRVKAAVIEGAAPSFESIVSGKYPIARPLFFYVKKAHLGRIPGLKEYLAEFSSAAAIGADGYLLDRGLLPLPAAEYAAITRAARGQVSMQAPIK
jgi:phosphate transport system substrate-binding protein